MELVAAQMRLVLQSVHLSLSSGLTETLAVVVAPMAARAVIAKQPCSKKTVVLVPTTPSIACSTKIPDAALVLSDGGDGTFVFASQCVKAGKDGDEFIAPFWCVQPADRQEHANMQWEVGTKSVPGDFHYSGEYTIPVLVNHKPLSEGDVLKYYRPADGRKYPRFEDLQAKSVKRRRLE